MRSKQREATRTQIVVAALESISETGFDGVSTRAIAKRANVSQGLLTYHFKSKESLWRAAAERLFEMHNEAMRKPILDAKSAKDSRERLRELVRRLVLFNAAHPEFMRFIFDSGKDADKRSRWLVENHIRPLYSQFANVLDLPKAEMPHAFYAIVGACGSIFCAAEQCKQATGTNPKSKAAIMRHADYVADLFVPN